MLIVYLSGVKMAEQMQKPKSSNPLSAYFRQPKLYLTLPSEGKYYADGALDLSVNGEYPVYAMTAKDELIFKTPDALLNGQATVELIRSCIPAIKDPWGMPSIDLDACLIAIRIATYGEGMDFDSQCPSCSHENTYEMNLLGYLDQVKSFKYNDTVSLPPLEIKLRPYNYREVTKASLQALEQQKIYQVINDENLDDEEKLNQFGQSFVKLTDLTIDIVARCIAAIETPEGVVTDQDQILEFINNAPKDVFNTINDQIKIMREQIDLKVQDVKCAECGTSYQITLTMDQTNFFV